MMLKDVILMGIALAMDAFGLTISLGINPNLSRNNKIKFILSFSFFQFLFLFLGGAFGLIFSTYIARVPDIIGGMIIAIIGIIMIFSALNGEDKNDIVLIKKAMYLILGISVSIDALLVGFTAFSNFNILLLSVNSILVGLITLLLCTIGFFICRYIRKIDFICKYADILGGLILILLGIEMIIF